LPAIAQRKLVRRKRALALSCGVLVSIWLRDSRENLLRIDEVYGPTRGAHTLNQVAGAADVIGGSIEKRY